MPEQLKDLRREISFESMLFEKISKKDLVDLVGNMVKGKVENSRQVDMVMRLVDMYSDYEKRSGPANIEMMSILDAGRQAVMDDAFIEVLSKALTAKRRIKDGKVTEDKHYKELKETVKNVNKFRGGTEEEVKEKTSQYLSGEFDKGVEDGRGKGKEREEELEI